MLFGSLYLSLSLPYLLLSHTKALFQITFFIGSQECNWMLCLAMKVWKNYQTSKDGFTFQLD